jgi:Tol biopolymer transport system component
MGTAKNLSRADGRSSHSAPTCVGAVHVCTVSLTCALMALGANAASASPATGDGPVCSISQITKLTTGAGRPHISGRGTRIVFWWLDVGLHMFDTTTGEMTQLTTNEGFGHPFAGDLAIDGTGMHVAYSSTANPVGGNADGNVELFVIEPDTGRIAQVTDTSEGINYSPALNGAGTRVAFLSQANLTGHNPDGRSEVVLFDMVSRTFLHVGFGSWPGISGTGDRVAFLSEDDLTGENPEGNPELFLFDSSSGLAQVTRTTTGGRTADRPSMSHDGTRIAFLSTADLTGDNPDGNSQFFVFDATTRAFTQITQDGAGPFSSMDAEGRLIAFRAGSSTGNIEVYLADTGTGTTTQLTTSGSQKLSVWPSIDALGGRIAFYSNGDLTGENSNGTTQVFLATCGVVNAHVSLAALEATFKTSADMARCPAGVSGTFSFTGSLRALPGSAPLSDLRLQVHTLTNANLLENGDVGPARVAGTLTVPPSGEYSDGVLGPGEVVDVPFVICLQDRSPFQFLVDVLGKPR